MCEPAAEQPPRCLHASGRWFKGTTQCETRHNRCVSLPAVASQLEMALTYTVCHRTVQAFPPDTVYPAHSWPEASRYGPRAPTITRAGGGFKPLSLPQKGSGRQGTRFFEGDGCSGYVASRTLPTSVHPRTTTPNHISCPDVSTRLMALWHQRSVWGIGGTRGREQTSCGPAAPQAPLHGPGHAFRGAKEPPPAGGQGKKTESGPPTSRSCRPHVE